jgi:hypothetical protein
MSRPSRPNGSIRLRFTSPWLRGGLVERRYEATASPFRWTFTRNDLTTLLAKIENKRFASVA